MTAAQKPATSQDVAAGKRGRGTPGDAASTVPDQVVGSAGQPDTALPTHRRRRWPIWSEPHPRLTVPCNICGFSGRQHSTVCPFGPEPTKSRVRR